MAATHSVQNVQDLIERNKIWAENFKKNHAERLQSNASGQSPKVLWIGCSDSRVPETEILQCIPGDIFVHRNIANVVVPSDVSYLSVLQYAVEHLKVEDIVVCGHTKCGGVHASLSPNKHGFVDNWLHNIKMVAESHKKELEIIKDPEQKANRLIELNVQQSVNNLANSLPVKEAWERGQKLTIHGWVYDVATGLVRDLKISNLPTNGH
jgi:carbonic anhydrase